jgi:SAM-dependent methyltransferase
MRADEERIAGYYDRLVDRYGHGPRAVDASSAQSLQVRYRALGEVTDLSGKDVLEVGCGLGDLGEFLRRAHEGVRYTGLDISPRMLEEGRRVHPDLDLQAGNVLDLEGTERFDVVLAQGIFYLLGDEAEVKMQALIEKMFALAREAVAFSTVSTWAPLRDPDEFQADPVRLLEWARTLTTSLVLRHDYHPGDVTMYLYKAKAP